MRRMWVLPVAVLLGLATPAVAGEPQQLLENMNAAFVNLNYDGVFSYYSGEELASLRVVHKVVGGVTRERLVHLNGAPREIVRFGDEVECIVMPGDDLLALEQSIPAGPFARAFVRQFERLSANYAVDEFGEGRIAGRAATRIAVSPKDRHRYGFRLWLDQASALLLRSELVDHEGRKLEIFQFNEVTIGDAVSDAALEPQQASGSQVSHLRLEPADAVSTAQDTDPQAAFTTTWLPAGFTMVNANVRAMPVTGQAIASWMYSDGLSAFSIFIEPMPQKGASSMMSQTGATVALTHGIVSSETSYLVTLVGEIPARTARQIIASVRQK